MATDGLRNLPLGPMGPGPQIGGNHGCCGTGSTLRNNLPTSRSSSINGTTHCRAKASLHIAARRFAGRSIDIQSMRLLVTFSGVPGYKREAYL
jgi:hypothetical protein